MTRTLSPALTQLVGDAGRAGYRIVDSPLGDGFDINSPDGPKLRVVVTDTGELVHAKRLDVAPQLAAKVTTVYLTRRILSLPTD
jgi:hypothetical protein